MPARRSRRPRQHASRFATIGRPGSSSRSCVHRAHRERRRRWRRVDGDSCRARPTPKAANAGGGARAGRQRRSPPFGDCAPRPDADDVVRRGARSARETRSAAGSRAKALRMAGRADTARRIQPGLFDRRALRAATEVSRSRTRRCGTPRAHRRARARPAAAPLVHADGRADRVALKGISGSLASLDLLEAIAHAAAAGAGASRSVAAAGARGPRSGELRRDRSSTCSSSRSSRAGPRPRSCRVTTATRRRCSVARPRTRGGVAVGRRLERRSAAAAASPCARAIAAADGGSAPTARRCACMDVTRAYTQRAIDFDLERIEEDDRALARPGRRPRRAAPSLRSPRWRRSSRDTEQHRAAVGRSLQAGVEDRADAARRGIRPPPRPAARALDAALADALTIVYRILFSCCSPRRAASCRSGIPIYRDSYTIESLRPVAEGRRPAQRASGRRCRRSRGWRTAAAPPARCAWCRSTAACSRRRRRRSPRSFALDDRVARDVLLAVTTRPGADRRERITYADLGVEQLGAVYERVLDYAPAVDGRSRSRSRRSGRRKDTGTFYTPRAMTEYLVRRTLAPLVRGRDARAHPVAARRRSGDGQRRLPGRGVPLPRRRLRRRADCRREPSRAPTSRRRTAPAFRRVVAQRCLYGVDLNPTAVQLARLSLWLCTLAADRPLTFLDHHLRAGNSLAGARAGRRRAPAARSGPAPRRGAAAALRRRRPVVRVASTVAPRVTPGASEPDDSAAVVHAQGAR